MSGLSVTPARSHVVDFSHSYWTERSAVAIKLKSNKSLYFVRPLALSILVVYFVLPFVCGVTAWGLDEMYRHVTCSRTETSSVHVTTKLFVLYEIIGCFVQNIFTNGE